MLILRKTLYFIPTLLVISFLAFGLSKLAPGDPVTLASQGAFEEFSGNQLEADRVYQETWQLLGLDKPFFYFAISARAFPDTLYRIPNRDRREALRKLCAQTGNWQATSRYMQAVRQAAQFTQTLPDSLQAKAHTTLLRVCQDLQRVYDPTVIRSKLELTDKKLTPDDPARPAFEAMAQAFEQYQSSPERYKLRQPDIKWYGLNNQYHNWLFSFLRGDMGRSYQDGRNVATVIGQALRWTLGINLTAILLAYLISVPLGVSSAVRKDSLYDRAVGIGLFILYSLPSFWIATLLLIFFTTPEYGMQFFSITGITDIGDDTGFWERFRVTALHMVLPVFCLTYGALAFITRQMRTGMVDVLQQDYIRTARAKGLSPRVVTWKHAFRNALFPLITIFGSVFPSVIAGSVVVEYIFNIPGMGKLTVDAIRAQNWPVVYGILMLTAIMTMIGILVADILYALADPRISLNKKK